MASLSRHFFSDEYQNLLKPICFQITYLSFTSDQSYRNLADKFDTHIVFDFKSSILSYRYFPCSDNVINIVLAFCQISSFFQLSFK